MRYNNHIASKTEQKMNLDDLPEAEYQAAMDQMALQGFKLFVFGFLTFGIYPIVVGILEQRKLNKA